MSDRTRRRGTSAGTGAGAAGTGGAPRGGAAGTGGTTPGAPTTDDTGAPAPPTTKRELLAGIRELVGEVAEIPPERRRVLLQSLGSALDLDLRVLYDVLHYLRDAAESGGGLRKEGRCECGAMTVPGIVCPRCGTMAE